jgi:Pyruvate/2-oxoacid:ferredoxin oxidoreductase gamma subunit
MFEIRIHGRGGQGVVTPAELLSVSAFDEGRHARRSQDTDPGMPVRRDRGVDEQV